MPVAFGHSLREVILPSSESSLIELDDSISLVIPADLLFIQISPVLIK